MSCWRTTFHANGDQIHANKFIATPKVRPDDGERYPYRSDINASPQACAVIAPHRRNAVMSVTSMHKFLIRQHVVQAPLDGGRQIRELAGQSSYVLAQELS